MLKLNPNIWNAGATPPPTTTVPAGGPITAWPTPPAAVTNTATPVGPPTLTNTTAPRAPLAPVALAEVPQAAQAGALDERDAMIAQLQAQLAAMRPAPASLPGEVYRERVDGTLLVFCAEVWKDLHMVAAYTLDDDGKRSAKPVYSKSYGKAMDPVYRAAVAGVHRLHEEQEG